MWTVVGTAILAAVLALTLRQTQPVFATLLTVAAGGLLFVWAISGAIPAVETLYSLLGRFSDHAPYADVLIKALGISLLTQMAAEICRDAGETALAGRAELAGKVMLLLCGMPLFEHAVSLLEQMVTAKAVSG